MQRTSKARYCGQGCVDSHGNRVPLKGHDCPQRPPRKKRKITISNNITSIDPSSVSSEPSQAYSGRSRSDAVIQDVPENIFNTMSVTSPPVAFWIPPEGCDAQDHTRTTEDINLNSTMSISASSFNPNPLATNTPFAFYPNIPAPDPSLVDPDISVLHSTSTLESDLLATNHTSASMSNLDTINSISPSVLALLSASMVDSPSHCSASIPLSFDSSTDSLQSSESTLLSHNTIDDLLSEILTSSQFDELLPADPMGDVATIPQPWNGEPEVQSIDNEVFMNTVVNLFQTIDSPTIHNLPDVEMSNPSHEDAGIGPPLDASLSVRPLASPEVPPLPPSPSDNCDDSPPANTHDGEDCLEGSDDSGDETSSWKSSDSDWDIQDGDANDIDYVYEHIIRRERRRSEKKEQHRLASGSGRSIARGSGCGHGRRRRKRGLPIYIRNDVKRTKCHSERVGRLMDCAERLEAATRAFIFLYDARPESILSRNGRAHVWISSSMRKALRGTNILNQLHNLAKEYQRSQGLSQQAVISLNSQVHAAREVNRKAKAQVDALKHQRTQDAATIAQLNAQIVAMQGQT